ncbi:MAG: sulfatase [Verrucomicrobiota bacterium]
MKSLLLIFTLTMAALAIPLKAAPSSPTNIIIFLVDDMGWTDCGVYGSDLYETPNIDKFASQAMRFTNAYAHPLCSPSRASIMTGQEESRHGITSAKGHQPPEPPGPQVFPERTASNQPYQLPISKNYLDPDAVTLAEALRDAGYHTAHMGKWHLGLTPPHWPDQHGFQTIFHSAPDPGPPNSTYFSPHNINPDGEPSSQYRVGNIVDGPDGEHIADRLTEEAVQYIKERKDEPFFLNLWQYSVHGPWEAKEEYIKAYAEKIDPNANHTNPVMAAMLQSMDESLGRIMTTLEELEIADNTIVVFFSDNGGNVHSMAEAEQLKNLENPKSRSHDLTKIYNEYAGFQVPTNNTPLREGKARLYEGGVRVPLIIRWPEKIPADTVSEAIVNNIDLYPTLLDLVEVPMPKNHIVDGISIAAVLTENAEAPRDTSFSWFPHQRPGIAVRKGDWKLIRRFKEDPARYEGLVELFNLKDDIGETKNLAKEKPELVAELGKLIDDHFKQTGGLYPEPNPNYNAEAAANIAAARNSPTVGLVPKFCTIETIDGAIRVTPENRKPFLGSGRVKLPGPLTLQLRARSVAGNGGAGLIQWKTDDQDEFPADSQTTPFELAPNKDWQNLELTVPVKGKSGLLRIYLPGAETTDFQSITWKSKHGSPVSWDFSNLSP